MDALDVARRMITVCVLTGNVALAREYAIDYAAARDDMMTSAEARASIEARSAHMKVPRLECEKEPGRGNQPKGRNHDRV